MREEFKHLTFDCMCRWVRALDREGILRHARYITSNNGGSWFNTAFSYQNLYTRAQFLGEYIEPKDLTLEAAIMQGSAEGSYAKAIADSNFLKVREQAWAFASARKLVPCNSQRGPVNERCIHSSSSSSSSCSISSSSSS